MIRLGAIVIDSGCGDVWLGGRRVRLTRDEFEIVRILLRRRGHYVPCVVLFDRMHQLEPVCDWPGQQTVVVQISKLRPKLAIIGLAIRSSLSGPTLGDGYRIEIVQEQHHTRRAA